MAVERASMYSKRCPGRSCGEVFPVIVLTALGLVLAQASIVGAHAAPIVLTVQLRTVTEAPIPNIAVRVVDAAADHVLAAGTTDTRGQAHFTDMSPTEI